MLCLLGSPVAHSVSPEMHNEACDQLGLDYTYLAFDVPEEKMPQAVEGLRTMGARGWNITMPGKNIMCKLGRQGLPCFGDLRRMQYHRQRQRRAHGLHDRRRRLHESGRRERRGHHRQRR